MSFLSVPARLGTFFFFLSFLHLLTCIYIICATPHTPNPHYLCFQAVLRSARNNLSNKKPILFKYCVYQLKIISEQQFIHLLGSLSSLSLLLLRKQRAHKQRISNYEKDLAEAADEVPLAGVSWRASRKGARLLSQTWLALCIYWSVEACDNLLFLSLASMWGELILVICCCITDYPKI
jgi:hypothetical protein